MSNLTISESRSIAKGRNIDGYKNTSKNNLTSFFLNDKHPKSEMPRPIVFKPISFFESEKESYYKQ